MAKRPGLVIGMQAKQRGFTLIEILIVVAIIGISLSFALLAFGDFGKNRQVLVAAEQFFAYIKLIQQQAILQTNTLGIKISNQGYQAYSLTGKFNQRTMRAKSIFRRQSFPANVVVNLHKPGKSPDIFIDASGEMAEFQLDFGTAKLPTLVSLIAKADGSLRLHNHAAKI